MSNTDEAALLIALLLAAIPARAAGLPDTGQDTCYNDNGADVVGASDAGSVAGDSGTHPRQDCRYGRDAAAAAGVLTKTGGGVKGFDYTKIADNGATLGAGAVMGTASGWACTRDNITGLTWEAKTLLNTDLHFFGHSYTWYYSAGSANGGSAGDTGTNTCNATLPGGLCNTQALVAAVNAAALCTYTDWRMPTRRELLTLIYVSASIPAVDQSYFPDPPPTPFWTVSSYAPAPSSAWYVDFVDGYSNSADKSSAYAARLVRGGPF